MIDRLEITAILGNKIPLSSVQALVNPFATSANLIGMNLLEYYLPVEFDFNASIIMFSLTDVGGIAIPTSKLTLLAPYIGFALTTMIAAVATAVYVKRVKRRKEKQ